MDYLFIVTFIISTVTIFSTNMYSLVNANDAEFGRVITFDNFDHYKVSIVLTVGEKMCQCNLF